VGGDSESCVSLAGRAAGVVSIVITDPFSFTVLRVFEQVAGFPGGRRDSCRDKARPDIGCGACRGMGEGYAGDLSQ